MTQGKVIEVDSLVKKYGELIAVNGISFSVEKAEVFAFLGPNGAGKTTTVEILECLRNPTSGEAHVLGFDVRRDQAKIRERIGVLPQEFNTFELLTVRETIDYFGKMFGKKVDSNKLIELVDLEDKKNTLCKNLSGGLKQRLGVAISLVNDPEIVFLDEPTSGLDPKARHRVWDVIRGLRDEGKSIFLTTHYMEEVQILANTVSIINHGKIIAHGDPDDLILKHGGMKFVVIKKGGKAVQLALNSIMPKVTLQSNNVIVPLSKHSDLTDVVLAIAGKEFEDVEIRTPSMEDVFLNLTGKKIGNKGVVP